MDLASVNTPVATVSKEAIGISDSGVDPFDDLGFEVIQIDRLFADGPICHRHTGGAR